MFKLIGIVLSGNFWIGAIVSVLAIVGYLYYTGSTLNWTPKKKA